VARFKNGNLILEDERIVVSGDESLIKLSKNLIINGNFDIWQRGTSQTANGYGSVDRFLTDFVGSTNTMSLQSFTVGQTDVPNAPTYYARHNVTGVTGASNYCIFLQRIEGVRLLAGETVTLSFWAKANINRYMSIEAVQYFGTGGSPSSPVYACGVKKHSITTSWQKYTYTFSFPSISGKTLGTGRNDYQAIVFWFDGGSSFDSRTDSLGHQSGIFDISQVQLEKGSTASDFENRSFADEMLLCQRYYEKSYPSVGAYPGSLTATGMVWEYQANSAATILSAGGNVKFSTEKRGTPTVTVYSTVTGTSGKVYDYIAAVDVTPTVTSVGTSGYYWFAGLNAASITKSMGFQWVADAEL